LNIIRVAVLLLGSSFLLPGFLQAEDKKTEFPKVTMKDLKENPEKYRGKVIQIEGILESDPVTSMWTHVQRAYLRLVEADGLVITSYTLLPAVVKGDRVRITGVFSYSKNGSNPLTFLLRVANQDGKVEKLPKEKE
jgi:hypothetical protein